MKAAEIAIYASLGAIAGFVLGYYIGKKDEEKRGAERLTELRSELVKKSLARKNDLEKEAIFTEKPTKDVGERLVKDIETYKDLVENLMAETESPDEDDDDVISKEDMDAEIWEHKSIWAADKKDPYLISYEDMEEHPELEKTTLMYYAGDRTLTTEDEELIEDVQKTVGNCLEISDFENSDDRTIFVRNKVLGCDFEIVKVDGSYY